jgi:phenylacetic acid degradation operon negative regulatory protein
MTVAPTSIPTLSARSVALSVLLGVPNGSLPVRDILATAEMCDIAPATMRVALSRLVSAGELAVQEGSYSLSPHHRERLRAQHRDIAPRMRPWDGTWETIVVVESGRDAGDRARLRGELAAARLAELREGVWMRPANLDRPMFSDPHTAAMLARPTDPEQLVGVLWDLAGWAHRGREILQASAGPALDGRRFAAVTALVRHLRTDPALPAELTPDDWPADELRAAYDNYRAQLRIHHVPDKGELP